MKPRGNVIDCRRLIRQYFIRDFEAVGTLVVDAGSVDPEKLRALLVFAGRRLGIGVNRSSGWGRFTVAGEIETNARG